MTKRLVSSVSSATIDAGIVIFIFPSSFMFPAEETRLTSISTC